MSSEGEPLDNRGGDAASRRPLVDVAELPGGPSLLCQAFLPVSIEHVAGIPGSRTFTVHYKGWNKGYDEKLTEDEARIRFRKHCKPPPPFAGCF